MRILRNLKNKRGDTFIMTMGAMFVAFVFVMLIIDFGFGFINKVQLQNVADAATIGGASYGKSGYCSIVDGKLIAVVDESKAKSKAQAIIKANEKYMMDRATVTDTKFNPSGKDIDGTPMGSRDQYFSGNFTTEMSGKYETILLTSTIFDQAPIPYLNYNVTSRVHVTPVLK